MKNRSIVTAIQPKYELIGTHTGRRTFICNALSLGIPAQVVMKWTGHSDYKAMKPYIDIADHSQENEEDKYVYGIAGIAELFHCSLPTANRIKKSGRIKKAITQIGRKIVVDKKMALELAGQPTFHRRGA